MGDATAQHHRIILRHISHLMPSRQAIVDRRPHRLILVILEELVDRLALAHC